MEIIVGATSAATVASLLVALFKLGVPGASSALIALFAFLVGQVAALLVTAAQGGLSTEQTVIASVILMGIMAAATAAGISRTDQSAEAKRTGPEAQAHREVVATLGGQDRERNRGREDRRKESRRLNALAARYSLTGPDRLVGLVLLGSE